MSTMYIYRHNELIDSKEIIHRFCITQSNENKELYWEADEEMDISRRGGIIQIWIRHAASHPEIVHVLPPWQLIIDETVMEQGVYYEVNVAGRKVELQFVNYKFACVFPIGKQQIKSDITAIRTVMKAPPISEKNKNT